MATKPLFLPSLQIPVMGNLQATGLISELKIRKTRKGSLIWNFRINDIEITGKNILVKRNFSNYLIKMIYYRDKAPRVFIEQPLIKYGQAPHLYKDDSLCLYKQTLWQWKNEMSFTEELFPTVCLWLYYYQMWQETGIWYGQEAKHDMNPILLNRVYEEIQRLQSQA